MLNVRIKVSDLRNDLREAITEWVRSGLDLDPGDFGDWILVRYQSGPAGIRGGRHVLHLSKRRRGEQGGVVLDQATGTVVTEPLVVELTAEQWAAMPKVDIEAVA
jgi:hypothetical protein